MTAVRLAWIAAALGAFAPAAIRAADPPAPASPSASAPPPTAPPPPQIALGLTYTLSLGAQRCPSEKVFRDEVAAKMGYDPFTTGVPEAVVITLTRSTRGSTATVEFNDAAHARRWKDKILPISDNNCVELVYATALYMTLQWLPFPSPPSTAAPSAPPPPPPPPPPAETAAPKPPPSAPAPPPRAAPHTRAPSTGSPPPSPPARIRRPYIELGAGLFGALGIAPSITWGGIFHAGLRWPLWSLAFEARLDAAASRDVEVDMLPSVRVTTKLTGGSVVPCWYPHPLVLLCGVATGGQVQEESTDMRNRKTGRSGYFGAGLRGGMQKQIIDHLIVRGHVEILGSVVSAGADLGAARVWRAFPLSGGGGISFVGFF